MRFACTLGFENGYAWQYFFCAATYREAEDVAEWGKMKERADRIITIRELPEKSWLSSLYSKKQA